MDNLVLLPSPGYIFITPEEQQDSQIIIKQGEKDQEPPYVRGRVVKVGKPYIQDGVKIIAPCEPNDLVLYTYSGYEEIIYKGAALRIVRFSSVVGVYKESN